MKKTGFLFLAVAALMGTKTSAQDTLHNSQPLDTYFYNDFPTTDTIHLIRSFALTRTEVFAKLQLTKDSLTIYGIAAAIYAPKFDDTRIGNLEFFYEDTTFDNCIESLRLYQADIGTLTQIGEDLPIHLIDTPVTYYWDSQKTEHPRNLVAPFPVYERYFATPHTMVDSFYVAITGNSYYEATLPNGRTVESRYGMGAIQILPFVRRYPHYTEPIAEYFDSQWNYWYRHEMAESFCTLIFPILRPNSNGGGAGGDGGDTLAVDRTDMLGHLITVSPNPATGHTRVLSSFGLQRIEAFNTDGRQVLGRPADGLTTDLDLTGWAPGTYLLRIHTPLGTTSRKLVVR